MQGDLVVGESIEISSAPRGRLSTRAIAMPADTNPFGHVFGGWMLAQMDLAGGTHAYRRAGGHCPTIAVEGMEFLEPVHVGDEVSCYTEIIRVGRTSISIRIQAWVRRNGGSDRLVKVTSAIFTYVAIDPQGRKRAVPPEE
ncbi:acyl-CoA thioesterase [Magnetospirillum sp. 15-1]|uniref:acyl-CoA thioesterase n=1 Tax=Magnetospirillum sp. 15-1 TaxID=1979370 RepID=UPI000BBCB843|nr:acyl-CoA thioesterase [Magnetospirillum sp. 15-1]